MTIIHTNEFEVYDRKIAENDMFMEFLTFTLAYSLYHEPNTRQTKKFIERWQKLNSKNEFELDACFADLTRWGYSVLICKEVDAFQFYVSQILKRVINLQPKVLLKPDGKDNEARKNADSKVDLREILEAGSIEEFVRRYADKKITDLGYSGLPKIIDFMNCKLSLTVDTSTNEFATACEFVEARNLIVHNAGNVSRLYLERTGRNDLGIDDPYPFGDKAFVLPGSGSLKGIAANLDSLIISKYRLTC